MRKELVPAWMNKLFFKNCEPIGCFKERSAANEGESTWDYGDCEFSVMNEILDKMIEKKKRRRENQRTKT